MFFIILEGSQVNWKIVKIYGEYMDIKVVLI